MRRWVIADTHFGHHKLVEEGHRPAGFEHTIIDRWIKLVRMGDLVIHLGDVVLPDSNKEYWRIIAGMPGRKILLMGNHDKRSVSWYMQRGFAVACKSIEIGGVMFTHEPLVNVPEHVQYNVHGHLHTGEHRPFDAGPKHRLFSLEATNYEPVQLEMFLRAKSKA